MVADNSLKKVRETRHFDLQAVAKYAGISADRLEEFETGEREPSPRQLERLADTYGLASYLLRSSTIPNLPETIADFRKREPGPAHLSPAGMARIWAAEEVAAVSTQLAGAVGLESPMWLKDLPTVIEPSISDARDLRTFFEDWFNRRREKMELSGAPEQQFMAGFRLFLEAQKTIVRINDAPPDDFLGFYLHPEAGFETVFVNRKISAPKAQLFTLVHEYSHKLLGLSGVSNPFVLRNDAERTCNRFAAEFLAPEKAFIELANEQVRLQGRDVYRLISAVSGRSLLSMHATAIRLVETGFLSQSQLKAWEAVRQATVGRDLKNEEREDDEQQHGAIHAKLTGEIGYLPTFLSKLAVEQKLIDRVDVHTGIGLTASVQEKAFSLAARRFKAAVS